jgi:hypothetical protein
MTPAGSGATGAACAFPDMAAKIKPATAIANTVRNIRSSLFLTFRPQPLVGSELAAISHELQGISVVPVGPSWNRRGMMQTDGRFDHF